MSFAMKKKILFVHNALWIGGIETALVAMLNRMDYSKYDVTCLITSNNCQLSDQITKKCKLIVCDRHNTVSFSQKYKYAKLFDIVDSGICSSKIKTLRNKLFTFFFRNFEERLYSSYIRNNIKETDFDVAIIFSCKVSGIVRRTIKAKKYLCFYHYSDMRRVYHDYLGYDICEKIFAVTDNLALSLKEFIPKYKEKIYALHNLVNTKNVSEMALSGNADELSKDNFNIVSCGRLHRDKGFDLAVEACKRLVDDGYTNLHWYVVGEGPESNNLRDLIEEYNASEHFHLLGVKSNPYPYMKVADIFVQSSRIEAFGLTITEALSLGVPVVSTATDGGKEIITDNVNGLLCDVSADSIYRAVKTLIENPELRKKLADGASEIDFEAQNDEIMKRLYAEL